MTQLILLFELNPLMKNIYIIKNLQKCEEAESMVRNWMVEKGKRVHTEIPENMKLVLGKRFNDDSNYFLKSWI